jgi:hypothetical protein
MKCLKDIYKTGNDKTIGGIGTILCQTDEQGKQRVISYASKQLAKYGKNYTPLLVEMAAMIWAMEHFDSYLRGRHFTVFSDHKPMETSEKKHDKKLSIIQEACTQWDYETKYKKVIEMPADYLSRNVVEAIDTPNEDLTDMKDQDKFCASLKHLLNKLPVEKKNTLN